MVEKRKTKEGVIRKVADGSKSVQILQMIRDRERYVAIHSDQRVLCDKYWDTFLLLIMGVMR